MNKSLLKKIEKGLTGEVKTFKPIFIPLKNNMYQLDTIFNNGRLRNGTFEENGFILDKSGKIQLVRISTAEQAKEMTLKFIEHNL